MSETGRGLTRTGIWHCAHRGDVVPPRLLLRTQLGLPRWQATRHAFEFLHGVNGAGRVVDEMELKSAAGRSGTGALCFRSRPWLPKCRDSLARSILGAILDAIRGCNSA